VIARHLHLQLAGVSSVNTLLADAPFKSRLRQPDRMLLRGNSHGN
jgi:hypothetical protein